MPKGIYKRTEEHNRKLSLALRGRLKHSEEFKKRMSIRVRALKGQGILGLKKGQTNTGSFTRERVIGDKNFNWKGDNVGYRALHYWVETMLGKASKCEVCFVKNAKRYHWANISRQYLREISDWIQLCVVCHKKYDLGKINISSDVLKLRGVV